VRRRPRISIAAALVGCALLAGCGGDDAGSGEERSEPPEAKAGDFPSARGKTIAQLREGIGSEGPVLAPSGAHFTTAGENRFGFALFNPDRSQISDAAVAVYVAPAGGGAATGPYPARFEPFDVKPQFQSRQTASDPDAAGSVYVASLPFDEPGRYDVLGIARIGGRLVVATPAVPGLEVVAEADDPVPGPGDRPPRIHTPTEADVGGDIASIDTRLPPSSMHDADFADVLGKKPVVLIFATPQLCQSRVCGPVVDVVEQVKADAGDDVEFIHMEVFRDNRIDRGVRPQLAEFQLRSEPWLFTFDQAGRVAARLEGAFSQPELEQAIAKATG
jgi:hypothetical protein